MVAFSDGKPDSTRRSLASGRLSAGPVGEGGHFPENALFGRASGAKIRLDRAAQLDGHGISVPVLGGRMCDPNPAFADAIFLDIGLLDALEADADAALEQLGIVIGAGRVVGEAVRRSVVHGNGPAGE